jgi:hypothetical protein
MGVLKPSEGSNLKHISFLQYDTTKYTFRSCYIQNCLQHRPTMVSLFEVFCAFFINFRTLNSKSISRFIHLVQIF